MKTAKTLGFIALVILAVLVMILRPFSPALNDTGQMILGGLIITVGIWIFKPFGLPFSMGGFFLAAFCLIAGLKPATVFSGFTQPAIWTLVPALFFGTVLQKTGLGRRLALGIIRLFRPSYPTLILAWVLIGVALSIMTPSITVRVAIMAPIAVQCNDLLELEKGSRGNSLLLITAFIMALLPGTGWFSGSLQGPILQGLFDANEALAGTITFESWSSVMFVPMELLTVATVLLGFLVLRPKNSIPKSAAAAIRQQQLDPPSRYEKISAIILVLVFTLFLTGRWHGISDSAICLLATVCFFAFGVLKPQDFISGINWDLVVFIAMALSLGAIFAQTGISEWISALIVPALAPIAQNPWIFLPAMLALLFLWRFVDVALLIPTLAILVPVLPAIYQTYGISPLVWIPLFLMATNVFLLPYQNMWALMTQSVSKTRGWKQQHLTKYGLAYVVCCFIIVLLFTPVWMNNGLL